MTNNARGFSRETTSDGWRTPIPIFKLIERKLKLSFTIDLAASKENALCPIYFTKEDSCLDLSSSEFEKRVGNLNQSENEAAWCNPPYLSTGLDRWMHNAHGLQIYQKLSNTLLVPASRTEQNWFHSVEPEYFHIYYFKKRIPFNRANGKKGGSPNHPSMLLFFPEDYRTNRLCGKFSTIDWEEEVRKLKMTLRFKGA